MRCRGGFVLAAALVSCVAAVQAWTVGSSDQDAYPIDAGTGGASELSGIAWAGGSQYFAVSDDGARLYPLNVVLDPTTGAIQSASAGTAAYVTGYDLEGIALAGDGLSAWISDETGPAIRRFSLSGGAEIATLALPAVFSSVRSNLSLESLARDPRSGALWTANEEALSIDGPVSNFTHGSTIRVQRFDANGNAAGQWAYMTDEIPGDLLMPGRDVEASGVSDLLVLPDGELLALERAFGRDTFFRSRIYALDRSTATDTSADASLASASFTPISKTLLWENTYTTANFEGISIGPRLANGDHSLVLVSDDGGFADQLALTLRLSTCAAQPRNDCLTPGASRLTVRRLGTKRDTLAWSWRKGTIPTAALFGDPTTAGPGFSLCVYQSSGGVAALAGSARVLAGNNWTAMRRDGFKYRDRTAAVDGMKAITLVPGTGKARVVLRIGGLNLRMPAAVAPTPLLRRDPQVIVQLVKESQPSQCFSSTYTSATRETAERFAAAF